MPRRIVVLLLLRLLQLLPLLQTLHLHHVLTLGTSVTTVANEAIPLRSVLPDAVIFKPRLTKSTPPYMPISRTSNALLVARMKVITFHHQCPGPLLFLLLVHHRVQLDLRHQGLPDLLHCLHLHPLRLLTSLSSTKFQGTSSLSYHTPARTLLKFHSSEMSWSGGALGVEFHCHPFSPMTSFLCAFATSISSSLLEKSPEDMRCAFYNRSSSQFLPVSHSPLKS